MKNEQEKMLLYKPEDTGVKVDVVLKDEEIWLTQKAMAELFDTTVANINMHIKKIYETNELEQKRTIKKSLMVQNEGEREIKRDVLSYNLDMIIAVGYRINSKRASNFRMWAMQVLKKYIVNEVRQKEKREVHKKEILVLLIGVILGVLLVRMRL